MNRVIDVSLSGHPEPFRLHEDAFELLQQYLDQARAGLTEDMDPAEVMGDLERSIGDKLADRRGDGRVVAIDVVRGILDEIGAVGTHDGAPVAAPTLPPGRVRRRLYRIREGEQWAGICTGLAAYAELDVSVVRWVFVLLALVTAGVFLLVYVAAMFILPVVPTREAFAAAQVVADSGP